MLANHLVENVPNLWPLFLDHFFCTFNRGDVAALFELVVDKGLEQLQSHLLRQSALVQPKFRSDNNDRTAGIIDPFAEQVLTEPTGFTLQHVAERFKRSAVLARDSSTPPAVIK